MPLTDYADALQRLQKGLAAQYAKAPSILNEPGMSVAMKLDQNYWLVVEPLFSTSLAKWSGMLPATALDTLTRTGNMITGRVPGGAQDAGEGGAARPHVLALSVSWPSQPQGVTVRAAFVLADFIERALAIHGETEAARAASHSLSDLRIRAPERDRVQAFFEGKTPPGRWAYDVPE